MQLLAISNLDEYRQRVETDQEEADSLFRDLLVEVTHFFRDPEAFEILRNEVIPKSIQQAANDEECRAWVCGCATGEEAYSIAMLIHDCMERAGTRMPFKIFATDVHPKSIRLAGEGVFQDRAMKNLPDSFRERYFNVVDQGFKIKQEIRQKIIFAINDATKDPPFTRLNLVTCRNVLIYLLPEAQNRFLSVL